MSIYRCRKLGYSVTDQQSFPVQWNRRHSPRCLFFTEHSKIQRSGFLSNVSTAYIWQIYCCHIWHVLTIYVTSDIVSKFVSHTHTHIHHSIFPPVAAQPDRDLPVLLLFLDLRRDCGHQLAGDSRGQLRAAEGGAGETGCGALSCQVCPDVDFRNW